MQQALSNRAGTNFPQDTSRPQHTARNDEKLPKNDVYEWARGMGGEAGGISHRGGESRSRERLSRFPSSGDASQRKPEERKGNKGAQRNKHRVSFFTLTEYRVSYSSRASYHSNPTAARRNVHENNSIRVRMVTPFLPPPSPSLSLYLVPHIPQRLVDGVHHDRQREAASFFQVVPHLVASKHLFVSYSTRTKQHGVGDERTTPSARR